LKVKEFFDRYWKHKHLRRFDSYYNFLSLINENIFEIISQGKHKKILLIGMGNTPDNSFFRLLDGEKVCIDVSMDGLKGMKDFQKVQMDAQQIGFKEGSFDLVFLRTVMLHLDHKKTIPEIKKLLRKNGCFFWVEPMKNNLFLWIYRCVISPGRWTRTAYLALEDIEEYGKVFAHVWHREYFLLTVLLIPVYIILPWFRKCIHMIQRAEMHIIDRFCWLRKLCWISYGFGRS